LSVTLFPERPPEFPRRGHLNFKKIIWAFRKEEFATASREIWHEISIQAPPCEVFQALADAKNPAHGWTTDTRGESKVGKELEFCFSRLCQPIEVTALKANDLVRWRVPKKGMSDRADTDIEFRILRREDHTVLHFRHSNWREDAKMFPMCSLDGAVFLLSLKDFAEKGKGHPYPYDMLPPGVE